MKSGFCFNIYLVCDVCGHTGHSTHMEIRGQLWELAVSFLRILWLLGLELSSPSFVANTSKHDEPAHQLLVSKCGHLKFLFYPDWQNISVSHQLGSKVRTLYRPHLCGSLWQSQVSLFLWEVVIVLIATSTISKWTVILNTFIKFVCSGLGMEKSH